MANATLAPEEDEPDFHRAHNLADRHNVTDSTTQFDSIRRRFDLKKVGFGLLPWPGIEQPGPGSNTEAIALQYLLEGADCNKEGQEMNSVMLSIVPLQRASLCLDCDMITAAHTHCLVCRSAALLNLAHTLNDERDDVAPFRAALAAAANLSAGRAFAIEAAAAANPRRSGRFVANVAFPYLPEEVDTDARGASHWQSLRGFAAVAHRAITVTLIGSILVLAATTPARGHSLKGTKTATKQAQLY